MPPSPQDNTSGAVEAYSGAIALKPRRDDWLPQAGGDLPATRRPRDGAAGPWPRGGARPLRDPRRRSARRRQSCHSSGMPPPPTATATTSRWTIARRACSTSSAFAQYHDDRAGGRDRRAQKAIALDDRFAEAYYLLGLCLRNVQRPDEARVALEQAVAIQPALLPAREELADLYGALSRTDDRLMQLEALSALDPSASREVASVSPTRARVSRSARSSRSAAPPSAIRIIATPTSRSAGCGWRTRRAPEIGSR